jgi:tRNA nucleotidyltransferase/poly(A) polymerase
MVPRIFNRMRLPQNEKMKFVQKLVRLHLRPIALVDEGVSDSAIRRLIVDAGEDLQALMTLCRADITTRDSRKLNRFLQKFDELEAKVAEVESRDELRNWQPAVTGQDIMEHFSLKPGPEVGALKLAIRNAILDGVVPNSRAEGLNWLDTIAPEVLADPRGWTERLKLLAPEA